MDLQFWHGEKEEHNEEYIKSPPIEKLREISCYSMKHKKNKKKNENRNILVFYTWTPIFVLRLVHRISSHLFSLSRFVLIFLFSFSDHNRAHSPSPFLSFQHAFFKKHTRRALSNNSPVFFNHIYENQIIIFFHFNMRITKEATYTWNAFR